LCGGARSPIIGSMAEPWRFEKLTLPNGLRMRVARAGGGPLVVMLHGFPECWYSWRHQLRALSASYECVAPDMRGYGETDAPTGVENYRIEALVGDVTGLIEALGHRRAIVVGHDWGGAVAWATAMMRPDAVARLCVLNCPHPARFRSQLRSNPRQMLRSWYILFFQIPRLPDALLRARDAAMVARMIRSTAVHKEAFTDDDLANFRDALKSGYSATAALNYYRALSRRDFLGKGSSGHWLARRIKAPTLLIWGEQDVALGVELTHGMERLFDGPFEIKYIPDSGHWVQQEKPELVNQYLAEFMASRPAGS
jgi:epoxide hydrolase 4